MNVRANGKSPSVLKKHYTNKNPTVSPAGSANENSSPLPVISEVPNGGWHRQVPALTVAPATRWFHSDLFVRGSR